MSTDTITDDGTNKEKIVDTQGVVGLLLGELFLLRKSEERFTNRLSSGKLQWNINPQGSLINFIIQYGHQLSYRDDE